MSVQSDLPSERDWLMSAHQNEAFKAYAIAFVLKDLAGAYEATQGESTPDEAD